jgi:DHA1 family purine base/nucleoside efflux pump-like MFS transporter
LEETKESMDDNSSFTEKRSAGRLVLFSLVASSFATMVPTVLVDLLLIDIGVTFGSSVGVTGQILTFSFTAAVIFALLMGAFSVRFKHKSLLMIGLVFFTISALGCSFAPSFNLLLIFYALTGVGLAMVSPMNLALVAEHFPVEKRTSVIAWLEIGLALSFAIGAPVIGFIAGLGGWRWAFLGFLLPICLASLLMVSKGLPYMSRSRQLTMNKKNYLQGFKRFFSNKSATACVVGTTFLNAGYQVIFLYFSSFLRERFLVSMNLVSIIFLGTSLSYILGSLVCGWFVNRFGRKTITVLATFLFGIFLVSYTNLPNLWLSLTAIFLATLILAMSYVGSLSLTLEQVPRFRGTVMSISSAATSLGLAIGAAVGGLALILYDYEFLGITGGILALVAAIFFLLAIDPAKT